MQDQFSIRPSSETEENSLRCKTDIKLELERAGMGFFLGFEPDRVQLNPRSGLPYFHLESVDLQFLSFDEDFIQPSRTLKA